MIKDLVEYLQVCTSAGSGCGVSASTSHRCLRAPQHIQVSPVSAQASPSTPARARESCGARREFPTNKKTTNHQTLRGAIAGRQPQQRMCEGSRDGSVPGAPEPRLPGELPDHGRQTCDVTRRRYHRHSPLLGTAAVPSPHRSPASPSQEDTQSASWYSNLLKRYTKLLYIKLINFLKND